MIDREHDLPITRQAEALNISRGSVYYLPRPVPDADLAIMRRLDRLHLEFPFAGSRMLRGLLAAEGCKIGRRHVKTLMRRMGIEALYRRPRTTRPEPGHKIHPYLLRGMEITRPNQVWAMDITYIPMARGFVYLAVVLDWFSRRVLSWRLSITMEAAFCVETLEDALARHGKPDIFNTDQGSQFTGSAFTSVLANNGIAISMDGKGAWRDDVFVERLWRSVKYEGVASRSVLELAVGQAPVGSGGQVNRPIGRPSGERRPAINFAHRDLTRCEQRPEQHRGGLGRGQHRLGLDPALEFLVKPLDGVGGSGRLPPAGRQSGEGEELLAGLLQAVGDGPALEPPLAQEGFAALLDLLGGRSVDHVLVVGGDLLVQLVGSVRQEVPVLVDRAPLRRHGWPEGGERLPQTGRTVDDEQLGRPQPGSDQFVEQRPPRRLALAAHVLDRQQHLLAVGADAKDDQEGKAGGLPVEPDADDRAVEDQPHDRFGGEITTVPGLPVGLDLAPRAAHDVLADRPAEERREAAAYPARVGAGGIGRGDQRLGGLRATLAGPECLAPPLDRPAALGRVGENARRPTPRRVGPAFAIPWSARRTNR